MKKYLEKPQTEAGNNISQPEKFSTNFYIILLAGFVALITTYNLLSLFTPFLSFSKYEKRISFLIIIVVFFFSYYLLFQQVIEIKIRKRAA